MPAIFAGAISKTFNKFLNIESICLMIGLKKLNINKQSHWLMC